jgi:Leucine-rich repeat (LRR) protein
MKILQEFRVNKFITLKLEIGMVKRWNDIQAEYIEKKGHLVQIYINGEKFRQCTYLLLVNPHLKEGQSEINSIDEARELLRGDLEERLTPEDLGITPEEEFWAHCSNLQAWVDHDYDVRLLDSRLAFPLLAELKKLGDPVAKTAFISEFSHRYLNGTDKTRRALVGMGYAELTREEQLSFLDDPDDLDGILAFEEQAGLRPIWNYVVDELRRSKRARSDEYPIQYTLKEGKVIGLFIEDYPKNTEVPDAIGSFKHLKHLGITYNPNIETISEALGNLNTLKRLKIYDCEALRSLPKSIGRLENVDLLEIKRCPALKELPESFGTLKSLKTLSISKCEALKSLPESFGNLPSLEKLTISKCEALKSLPESFGKLPSLEKLTIRDCGLKTLPESFGNLPCKKIYVINCRLTHLPESIGTLPSAESLSFGKNQIRNLPKSIGTLPSVESLSFGENQIRNLPKSIGNINQLRRLWVQGNFLTHLPEEIANLKNLKSLTLDHNPFETFPKEVLGLTNLEILSIGNRFKGLERRCKIQTIPPEISQMKNLVDLKIKNTDIFDLPYTLSKLKSFDAVYAGDTEINERRKEYLEPRIGARILLR